MSVNVTATLCGRRALYMKRAEQPRTRSRSAP
jgi:hypothetical protein